MSSTHAYHRFLFVAQEGNCFLCGKTMSISRATESRTGWINKNGWTLEHVVPKRIVRRNKNNLAMKMQNLVLSHGNCNNIKGTSLPSDELLERLRIFYKDKVTGKYKAPKRPLSELRSKHRKLNSDHHMHKRKGDLISQSVKSERWSDSLLVLA